jgi:hypothetical protein
MNDIKALEAKYKELGAEIEALKESAKVKEWPQINDMYFTILNDGEIFCSHAYNVATINNGSKLIGNIFRTKEDAEKELETRKTIAELRAQPGRKKFYLGAANYCVANTFGHNSVYVESLLDCNYGFASTYFESKQAVQAAIIKVGEARILAAAKWLAMGE